MMALAHTELLQGKTWNVDLSGKQNRAEGEKQEPPAAERMTPWP